MTENKNETVRHPLLSNKSGNFLFLEYIPVCAPLRRKPKPLPWRRMENFVKKLQAEFVDLLRKQVEALELDAYVGLTDEERSEYYERQERIRDLDARMSEPSDRAA
jgi:hypothetical protein